MQYSLEEYLKNYLSLTKETRFCVIRKVGLDKDVRKIKELMAKNNLTLSKKILRTISEDTRTLIANKYKEKNTA
jgi:hypothetical protein